jgi:hypothetical protein
MDSEKQEIINKMDREFLETADQFFNDAIYSKDLGLLKEKSYRTVDKTEASQIKGNAKVTVTVAAKIKTSRPTGDCHPLARSKLLYKCIVVLKKLQVTQR